jgi:predicted RecA/RadA family phage recombinase
MAAKASFVQLNEIAGSVTQSGATIKTITAAEEIAAGLPVKEVEGVAKVLEAGDAKSALIGVVVRDAAPFGFKALPRDIGALSEGYIQVPVAEAASVVRGQPVYFDAANQVFTSESSGVAVRAVFASNGQADGCAEIQVIASL